MWRPWDEICMIFLPPSSNTLSRLIKLWVWEILSVGRLSDTVVESTGIRLERRSCSVGKNPDMIQSPIPTGLSTSITLIRFLFEFNRRSAFIRSVMRKFRKPILDVLNGETPVRVPFWLMRQAGRYLPEYRELRKTAGGFLNLVYDPAKAAEITVQPLRRFGMDAAILFSDILVVPHALGQDVTFEAGEGPRLEPIACEKDFLRLDLGKIETACQPVFETVARTREMLSSEKFDETTLIGFCGSPWTVICYMIEGRGSKDFESARRWALRDPASFQKLVDIVAEASCLYLAGQIRAGAEVIQLFESWAGLLDAQEFKRWVIAPTKKIRDYLEQNFPHIPVIGFPRGAGALMLDYASETGIDCIGLDQMMDPHWAAQNLQTLLPVQGNLDNVRLLAGGAALEEGLGNIHAAFKGRPWIFNLGHGVIKETDVANVEKLRDIVKGWSV